MVKKKQDNDSMSLEKLTKSVGENWSMHHEHFQDSSRCENDKIRGGM